MARVAALQLPLAFGEPETMLARIDEALHEARGADLVLLPELSLTGYVSPEGDFDAGRFAEPAGGAGERGLAALARAHGVALAGGLAEQAGAARFNSLVLFDAEGALRLRYRKRHPWIPETWATPGDLGTPLASVAGLTVAAAICYDIHFVAADAPAELGAADLLLFASAWVTGDGGDGGDGEGGDQRPGLLAAIARRFALPIANANWAEAPPRIEGQGASLLLSASGRRLARAGAGVECLAFDVAPRSR